MGWRQVECGAGRFVVDDERTGATARIQPRLERADLACGVEESFGDDAPLVSVELSAGGVFVGGHFDTLVMRGQVRRHQQRTGELGGLDIGHVCVDPQRADLVGPARDLG